MPQLRLVGLLHGSELLPHRLLIRLAEVLELTARCAVQPLQLSVLALSICHQHLHAHLQPAALLVHARLCVIGTAELQLRLFNLPPQATLHNACRLHVVLRSAQPLLECFDLVASRRELLRLVAATKTGAQLFNLHRERRDRSICFIRCLGRALQRLSLIPRDADLGLEGVEAQSEVAQLRLRVVEAGLQHHVASVGFAKLPLQLGQELSSVKVRVARVCIKKRR
mmetsp:Transcript_6327/g.22538  ORF Transcript_6327/g.22538 Transcript_6327/m.22538 type:complete len:225 (-) Transcript_6327:2502-3176(-)